MAMKAAAAVAAYLQFPFDEQLNLVKLTGDGERQTQS